ncbi:MAG TPA: N-acetylmuramoyl-L-alanine amidase [Oligoflexia bacterium]|nr:N-acetylmuramoyl-L-alanine amidase [Oligoflexia bacterium]
MRLSGGYFHACFLPVILGWLMFLPVCAAAAPKDGDKTAAEFKRVYGSYQRLLRQDAKAVNLEAWEKAASQLLKFVREYDNEAYTPRALFALGELYETTYHKRRFQSGLSKAVYFYEELTKAYAASDLADDALLRLGDLRRTALRDEASARTAYYEIINRYPRGDKNQAARSRLGLERKVQAAQPGKKPEAQKEEELQGDLPQAVRGAAEEEKPAPLRESVENIDVGRDGKEIFTQKVDVSRPLIVIDAGHGGKEEGAKGVDGVLEKNVVLDIAKMVDKLLRDRLRARTVLTRTTDIDLTLAERTQIANAENADLFVSIHANASEYKTGSGIETYYLDNTEDKSSLKLAQRENASLGGSAQGGDLGFMLSDLIQDAKTPDSIALAHHIQDALVRVLSRYYKDVKDLGVKKAPFYVLVGAHMPCVLVEVSFIDHPVEGRRLIKRRYQRLVALAIYEGIRAYFESR